MKKKKWIISIIFFVIFIVGAFIFLQIYRHSSPEITELSISTSVTEDNKPVNPTDTFYDEKTDIFVSGRIAHITKTIVKIELRWNGQNFGNYPKTKEISANQYPNNYFSFKLSKNGINTIYWPVGDYELKIYPEGDRNPIKPKVKFKVLEKKNGKEVTKEEKEEIEAWILQSDLNEYGDPKDTIYAGGTPLFNEATGETIDRFQYILSQHPERPWMKD